MAIHAERAFFEELLHTGNSLVKKCPLMTSLYRKIHCLHTCEGFSASLLLFECFIHSKMTQIFLIMFFSMNKKSDFYDGGRFNEKVESLCL